MLKIFATVFFSVFLAELGDKTQLATLIYAANYKHAIFIVFIASALALTLTSAIGVFAGSLLAKYISEKTIQLSGGILFIIIGILIIFKNAK